MVLQSFFGLCYKTINLCSTSAMHQKKLPYSPDNCSQESSCIFGSAAMSEQNVCGHFFIFTEHVGTFAVMIIKSLTCCLIACSA